MSEEYPLYPKLTEAGQEEAVALIESFKKEVVKSVEEVVGNLYANVMPYIEGDSWTNFRNELLDGLCDYNNKRIHGEYDFKKIRKAIYKEYRDEIIKDLDQDMIGEIENLNKTIEMMQNSRMY